MCGGKYESRAPNRILVAQPGTNEEEAKVFRAHAIPQGLCENLITSLKLLSNQQGDGDSPIQNIVAGLREKSEKNTERTTKGLRSFTAQDNHCAVEVSQAAPYSTGCALLGRDFCEGSGGLIRLSAEGVPAVLLSFLSWPADGHAQLSSCHR